MPTNHAREAAERILSHVSCASDCPDIELVIQSAIDSATAELRAAYDASLAALDASHRIRDEQAEKLSPDTNDSINSCFHGLWTKAVGQDGYDKSEWKQLGRLLTARGIPV